MSTKAIRECLEYMRQQHGSGTMEDALAEVAAIEQAAKDMTRLHAGDMTYNIRETEAVLDWAQANDKSTWEAPDVKAWSDASEVLRSVAKSAP